MTAGLSPTPPAEPGHGASNELVVRVVCPGCGRRLSASLFHLATGLIPCPKCLVEVPLPPLDRRLRGVEEVLAANPPTLRMACPQCRRPHDVPLAALGQSWPCPHCQSPLTLRLTGADSTAPAASTRGSRPVPPPTATPAAATPTGPARRAVTASGRHRPHAAPTPPPSSAPAAKSRTNGGPHHPHSPAHPARHRQPVPTHPTRTARLTDDDSDEDYEEDDEAEPYDDEDDGPLLPDHEDFQDFDVDPRHRGLRRARGAPVQAKWVYRLLTYGIWIGGTLFFLVLTVLAQACVFVLPAALCLFGAWRIASLLMAAFVGSVRCPGCGEEHEMVARWNCACGYHDHRERHLYLFRCPLCKKVNGRINCERCDATIFTR